MNEQPETPQDNEPDRSGSGGSRSNGSGASDTSGAEFPDARSNGSERPRLTPRPVQRPQVHPAEESAFGRPDGVSGSFAPDREPPRSNGVRNAPPPPRSLAQAFGRPRPDADTLQRPPGQHSFGTDTAEQPVFWNEYAERDPWRDPASGAVVGPPAVPEDEPESGGEPAAGPLLSTREILFGHRVAPRTLATLTAIAVVLAAVGGLIGRLTAEEGNPLTNPDVTLAEAQPGVRRPAGTVANVAKRVVPSVVSVETHVGAQGGTGSGVVIDGNGYIITNNHVVSMAADTPNAQVSAVFPDGSKAPARIVGRDVKTDLAVIKVEVANPTVAQLGRSSDLAVGDDVIAIGSPLGLASTVTSGIVSSQHRPMRLSGEGSDTNAVIDAIQTDAAVNPGNSGGALVDGNGTVVGINSAIRTLGAGSGESGSIGLGFAIPIDDARRIAQELIRTGRAAHADLGVNAKSVSDGVADGAQVQNVQDGSAAAGAGIAEGDVITKVDQRKVGSADELVVAVDRHGIGQAVPITVVRQGRELVVTAQLK